MTDTLAKAALVTGGSGGIGQAVAQRLAGDGFAVAVHYSGRADDAERVVDEINGREGRAVAVQADVADANRQNAECKFVKLERGKDVAMRLDNQRVVIIGGSSGIGLETARLALAEGGLVTIAGRSEDRLRRAADSVLSAGNRLRTVVADLSEESSIRSLFAGEGHVDHVFVPAGELRPGGGDLLKADLDGLRSILEVRLLGLAHVVRQARPKMEGGSITLMSGLYSTRPAPGGGMTAAAIAAVEGMTRALALDLAPIRVNAVAPGLIDTPLWDSFGAQREAILSRAAGLPVGRIGRPEEVAAAVIFLMSNGFVTGAVLPIDGGGGLV